MRAEKSTKTWIHHELSLLRQKAGFANNIKSEAKNPDLVGPRMVWFHKKLLLDKIFNKSLELDIQILHDQDARKGSALLGDAYELWFRHDVIWSSYLAKLCRTKTFQIPVQIGSFERETDRYELHNLLNLYTDNKTYEFHLYILSCLEIYKLQFLNLIYKQKIRQFRKKKEIGVQLCIMKQNIKHIQLLYLLCSSWYTAFHHLSLCYIILWLHGEIP